MLEIIKKENNFVKKMNFFDYISLVHSDIFEIILCKRCKRVNISVNIL